MRTTSKGFLGSVRGMSLVEVLQMFHAGRRSASLLIEGNTPGRIDFDQGEVVHAASDRSTGPDAFRRLLTAQGGAFRTAPRESGEHTIDDAFDRLLMASLMQSEQSQDVSTDEIDGLDSFRSWCPTPNSESPSLDDSKIAPTPALPSIPAEESRLALCWRSYPRVSDERFSKDCLVLLVDGASAESTVLAGTLELEPLTDALLRAGRQLDPLTKQARTGVLEFRVGCVAAAMFWDHDDRAALLFGSVVAASGVPWFRTQVAALERHFFAADAGEQTG